MVGEVEVSSQQLRTMKIEYSISDLPLSFVYIQYHFKTYTNLRKDIASLNLNKFKECFCVLIFFSSALTFISLCSL